MPKWNNEIILIAFVAITGLAVLLQAIVLLIICQTARKVARTLQEAAKDLRETVLPVFRTSQEILDNIAPNIEAVTADVGKITADLAEITHDFRVRSTDLQSSAAEILERMRGQAVRIDGMVSSVLNTVEQASGMMQHAISLPMRKLSGVLAAFKAIFGSLRTPARRSDRFSGDKDLFV